MACGKSYKTPSHLKEHSRIHTGQTGNATIIALQCLCRALFTQNAEVLTDVACKRMEHLAGKKSVHTILQTNQKICKQFFMNVCFRVLCELEFGGCGGGGGEGVPLNE